MLKKISANFSVLAVAELKVLRDIFLISTEFWRKGVLLCHADIPEITEIKSVCIRVICGKVCSLKILCFALREAINVKKCIRNLGDVTMLRFSFLISTILIGLPSLLHNRE